MSSFTGADRLSTRDAVATETPAHRATSASVGWRSGATIKALLTRARRAIYAHTGPTESIGRITLPMIETIGGGSHDADLPSEQAR
ncbi:hypothetical protein GCM10018954_038450 [Kutzneria kofuensis]